jgi:uncharacterized membrane protein YkvA (DUF1232 family)
LKDLLLVLPRLARMIGGLLADREVPSRTKVALAVAALYFASPVDLIPDFIPFVGYLDDLLLAAVVVDGLLSVVDRPLVLKYWPGSVASLEAAAAAARRLCVWVPPRIKARVFGGRPAARAQ